MPARFVLPPLDADATAALRERFERSRDPETRLRYQMIILAAQGRSPRRIAPLVLRSHDTVTRVLNRSVADGLDAVPRRTAPGRAPTVPPAWEAELLRVIDLDPHVVGVASANWTTGLLARYLARATGVAVDQETARRALHAHGYVCKRPIWTLKRKAEEQEGYPGNG
jgi:transposase